MLHDGAHSHLLCRWNWEILEHPPYSPDMSPCDFDLFAEMKLPLIGVCFRRRQSILAAVEQSVRRLVQEDAVNGNRRHLDMWRRVLNVGGDYFRSLKQCDCSKNVFFVVNSNVALIIE